MQVSVSRQGLELLCPGCGDPLTATALADGLQPVATFPFSAVQSARRADYLLLHAECLGSYYGELDVQVYAAPLYLVDLMRALGLTLADLSAAQEAQAADHCTVHLEDVEAADPPPVTLDDAALLAEAADTERLDDIPF